MAHVRNNMAILPVVPALLVALILLAIMLPPSLAEERQAVENVRIFASATVEPYARALAETASRKAGEAGASWQARIMPAVRAVKAFCRAGAGRPALLLLARPLSGAERKACAGRGGGLTEMPLGRERLVLAQADNALDMRLTPLDLYLALAARVPVSGRLVPNPYQRWDEVNPSLPMRDIRVVVPAGSAHEALVRDVLQQVCRQGLHPYWAALKTQLMDDAAFQLQVRKHCSALRGDGAVRTAAGGSEAGRHLAGDATSLGLLGYSALRRHGLRALELGGVAGGRAQGLSRSLHLYAKGVSQDVLMWVLDDEVSGEEGVMVQQGLAPLSSEQRARLRQRLDQTTSGGMR